MLRLSRMTDYGVVVVGHLANHLGRTVTATDVANATGLSPATVSQVLKKLAHGELVLSHRGAHGGYSLARPPAEITVGELIATFDGPVTLTDCVDGTAGTCGVENLCPMRGAWDKVNTAIRAALDSVTLADMLAPMTGFGRGPARLGTESNTETTIRSGREAGV